MVPDTDWMIKLVDVYPDGNAMPVSEGILRARFREGLDKMKLLTPNQAYEYDIELTGTANVFKPVIAYVLILLQAIFRSSTGIQIPVIRWGAVPG